MTGNTIPSYPAATYPLPGNSAFPVWQGGGQRSVSLDAIAASIAGLPVAWPVDAANSASSAASSAAAAQIAASQTLAASLLSIVGVFDNPYASALPKGVTSGVIGGSVITGATVGTYALTPTGGSISGVQANLVVDSATTAHIEIVNTGRGTGTMPPTWAKPAGATLPAGTTLTAIVSNLVADQKTYWAASADSSALLLCGNNGGSFATAPFGGTQVVMPAKVTMDTAVARSQNALPFATWTALAAASSMVAGDRATVRADDAGTHTDPVVGGTVKNAGQYVYSASPTGWQRVADLDSQTAQALAPTTYETLVPSGMLLLDAGGRIVGRVPDPALTALIASAVTGGIYETTDLSANAYLLDAGGRIAAALGSTGSLGPEVTAARGNVASLTARLDPSITADGAPIINPYRPQLLRHSRYRLTKLSLPTPEAVLMGISAGGDSYTHNASRWINAFADKMAAKFGDAGMGFTGFGFLNSGNVAPWTSGNQPTYLNGNARPSKYPCRLYGSIVGTYYTDKGPDLAMATFTQAGDAAEIDFPAGHPNTLAKLLYVPAAGAAARVTTNGGSSWTALDLSIGTAGTLTTLSLTPPAGAATMRIEWVSGTCAISGAFARGTSGVFVNKVAATGSNISQFSGAPATSWENGFAAIEPNLFIYMDGTNSQGASIAAGTWGGYLANIISRARAAVPGIDILIATPPENQRTTNSVPMTIYPPEARKRAMALRFAFTDMQEVFGDPTNPTEYGSSGAIPLFASDLIHPDPTTGGRSLASQMLNAVVPYQGA